MWKHYIILLYSLTLVTAFDFTEEIDPSSFDEALTHSNTPTKLSQIDAAREALGTLCAAQEKLGEAGNYKQYVGMYVFNIFWQYNKEDSKPGQAHMDVMRAVKIAPPAGSGPGALHVTYEHIGSITLKEKEIGKTGKYMLATSTPLIKADKIDPEIFLRPALAKPGIFKQARNSGRIQLVNLMYFGPDKRMKYKDEVNKQLIQHGMTSKMPTGHFVPVDRKAYAIKFEDGFHAARAHKDIVDIASDDFAAAKQQEEVDDLVADFEYDIHVEEARENRAIKRLQAKERKILRIKNLKI